LVPYTANLPIALRVIGTMDLAAFVTLIQNQMAALPWLIALLVIPMWDLLAFVAIQRHPVQRRLGRGGAKAVKLATTELDFFVRETLYQWDWAQ